MTTSPVSLRGAGRSALRAVAALLLLAVPAVGPSCSAWPGLDEPASGGSTGIVTEPGVCSGSPLPCGALGTVDCAASAGCVDRGSCSGTSTVPGEACATQFDATSCNATSGCYWATQCTGSPLGTCSAFTKDTCLMSRGCLWTPTGTGGTGGSGGATNACLNYGAVCSPLDDCGCRFTCTAICSNCPSVCGVPCSTDADCASATGVYGTPTRLCYRPAGTGSAYRGICSAR